MTASQLIWEVQRVIQDSKAYPAEVVLGFLNQGLLDVASWDNLDPKLGIVGSILLPALEASGSVTTEPEIPYVDLPSDYHKELYQVSFDDQPSIPNILSNMRVFLEEYDGDLTNTGPIEDVTVVGSQLYFQPIPEEATELTLRYYAQPPLLVNYDPSETETDDIPICLPLEFHRGLLVNYALKEIYDEIEDGIDGQKLNTARYEIKYQQALSKLYQTIKHKSKQIPYVRRYAHFF